VRYLQGLDGVGIARFSASDVVRHALVARIVAAYDAHEEQTNAGRGAKPRRERE
jgi:phosphate starvation-inducible PhoH-like protein